MMPIAAPLGLVLEPLTAAHAPAMYAVLADPEIYRYLDSKPPESPARLETLYARWEARVSPDGRERWLNWVVRESSGALVGHVQATLDAAGRTAIAYVLASRYWGRGYARAATEAMMSSLAADYECAAFHAVVEAANARSIALLARLSFRLAGPAKRYGVELSPTELLFRRLMR